MSETKHEASSITKSQRPSRAVTETGKGVLDAEDYQIIHHRKSPVIDCDDLQMAGEINLGRVVI